MAGIRCPHCGSPIKIRGNRWECGWCGDFGTLASLKSPSRSHPSPKTTPELTELENGVWKILNGMKIYSPDQYKDSTFRLALYAMSNGLLSAGPSGGYGLSFVHTFLENYPVFSYGDFQKAVSSSTPVYAQEFSLSREVLGEFWKNMLPQLPPYETFCAWPDWLTDIFDGWSQVEAIFLGCSGELIRTTMEEMFNAHWCRRMTCFHTDALISAIQRWDFSDNEFACRDLLIARFPEAVRLRSPEKLLDMDTAEILEAAVEFQPQTALKMMKLLLDTAQGHLQEPEAAQTLLGDMLYDLCMNPSFTYTLLQQLKKDDTLARQLFQSAYADYPQEYILDVCEDWGYHSLAQHLKTLLENNPFFQGF